VIVYLLTIMLSGSLNAQVVLADGADCARLAQRMISHDPKLTHAEWTCEALPMLFRAVEPPVTPPQDLPRH
jgi:hypothetical protein